MSEYMLTKWQKTKSITAFWRVFNRSGVRSVFLLGTNRKVFNLCSVVASCLLVSGIGISGAPTCAQSAGPSFNDQAEDPALTAAREKVSNFPQDAKARYEFGRALRLAGKPQEAASEFLEATSIDPSLYVAYHELSLTKARQTQMQEAIDRLTLLKQQKPKDLMLRVALSELLEQSGNAYQAARVLVDIVYLNAVPENYLGKVNARIHYLLSKSKDAHSGEKVSTEETEEDSLPPPLPEVSLHRNLSGTKNKDARVTQGFGHTPLVP